MDEQDEFRVVIFAGEGEDEGRIGLVLKGTPLFIFEGNVLPGVAMTPAQAREIAENLLHISNAVEAGLSR